MTLHSPVVQTKNSGVILPSFLSLPIHIQSHQQVTLIIWQLLTTSSVTILFCHYLYPVCTPDVRLQLSLLSSSLLDSSNLACCSMSLWSRFPPPEMWLVLFLLPGMLSLQAFAWLKLSLQSKLHSITTYAELSPNNICKTNAFTDYLLSCINFLLLFYVSVCYLLCKLHKNKNFVLFTAVSPTPNDLCYGTSSVSKPYLLKKWMDEWISDMGGRQLCVWLFQDERMWLFPSPPQLLCSPEPHFNNQKVFS